MTSASPLDALIFDRHSTERSQGRQSTARVFQFRADWEQAKTMVLHLALKAAAHRELRALLEHAPGEPIGARRWRDEGSSGGAPTGLGAQRWRPVPPAITGR